jgi:hypothetical protein
MILVNLGNINSSLSQTPQLTETWQIINKGNNKIAELRTILQMMNHLIINM